MVCVDEPHQVRTSPLGVLVVWRFGFDGLIGTTLAWKTRPQVSHTGIPPRCALATAQRPESCSNEENTRLRPAVPRTAGDVRPARLQYAFSAAADFTQQLLNSASAISRAENSRNRGRSRATLGSSPSKSAPSRSAHLPATTACRATRASLPWP